MIFHEPFSKLTKSLFIWEIATNMSFWPSGGELIRFFFKIESVFFKDMNLIFLARVSMAFFLSISAKADLFFSKLMTSFIVCS